MLGWRWLYRVEIAIVQQELRNTLSHTLVRCTKPGLRAAYRGLNSSNHVWWKHSVCGPIRLRAYTEHDIAQPNSLISMFAKQDKEFDAAVVVPAERVDLSQLRG
jgi:hypothetical protein